MKKHFTFKKIALGLLILLLVFQIFRIDKKIEPINSTKDFLFLSGANERVSTLLQNACYDCHGTHPRYPWYTNIAPVSWWIKHHINEGTHHLNFSEWSSYTSRRKDHKLEECVEMIDEGEMPMTSYTWMHKDARLTKEDKELLISFFNSLRTHESDVPDK
jgi:hypothetical protein